MFAMAAESPRTLARCHCRSDERGGPLTRSTFARSHVRTFVERRRVASPRLASPRVLRANALRAPALEIPRPDTGVDEP